MAGSGDNGPVSLAFTLETTTWYSGLSSKHRLIANKRLRQLARDPESAPVRETSPGGSTIYSAVVVVDDALVRAYRVDFVRDEVMGAGGMPAIAVIRVRLLPR